MWPYNTIRPPNIKRQELDSAPCSTNILAVWPSSSHLLFLFFIFFKLIYLFYLWLYWVFVAVHWLSVVGATLHCGAWASHCGGFSCCRAQALGTQASVVVAHGLSSFGSRALEQRLSSCGTRAYLLRGMWDLPRPGLEPMSPALAGRFLTTAPPGKSHLFFSIKLFKQSLVALIRSDSMILRT